MGGNWAFETKRIVLSSVNDISLETAEEVAFSTCSIAFAEPARKLIEDGHAAFQSYLKSEDKYVYGSTTAPGARAKTVLSAEGTREQGRTLGEFITMRAGLGGAQLPQRTVRLAVLARLTNALSGYGKISLSTAQQVANLLDNVPEVPLLNPGPGEVMALTWLMAPLSELALKPGEAMALVNGSPFASAMIADVAITARRRLDLAEQVFALSIEAARAPLNHYRIELAGLWPDPFYRSSLERLNALLQDAGLDRLAHQAPVSWRIIPNVLAVAKRAVSAAQDIAAISLRSVKDNPSFILVSGNNPGVDVVSSGGFHDHQAARGIETVAAAFADLCVLISKLVARLVDGVGLGLPPLLTRDGADGVGTEYFVWTLTDPVARARQAAVPAGLDLSLEDPGGNQSDVSQSAFTAYGRHLEAGEALEHCLATLATVAALAIRIRATTPPPSLGALWDRLAVALGQFERTADAAGTPLRNVFSDFQSLIMRSTANDVWDSS